MNVARGAVVLLLLSVVAAARLVCSRDERDACYTLWRLAGVRHGSCFGETHESCFAHALRHDSACDLRRRFHDTHHMRHVLLTPCELLRAFCEQSPTGAPANGLRSLTKRPTRHDTASHHMRLTLSLQPPSRPAHSLSPLRG